MMNAYEFHERHHAKAEMRKALARARELKGCFQVNRRRASVNEATYWRNQIRILSQ